MQGRSRPKSQLSKNSPQNLIGGKLYKQKAKMKKTIKKTR